MYPPHTNFRRGNSRSEWRCRWICNRVIRIGWRLIILIRWKEVCTDLTTRRRHEDLVVSPSLVVCHIYVRSWTSLAILMFTRRSTNRYDCLRTFRRIWLFTGRNQLICGQYAIGFRIVLQVTGRVDVHILLQVRCKTLNERIQISALMFKHVTGVFQGGFVSIYRTCYCTTTTNEHQ